MKATPSAGDRWRNRWSFLAKGLLPQSCTLCAAAADALVCADCMAALPMIESPCPICALPTATGDPCTRCRVAPPAFDASVAAFRYAFPLDRLIQSYKYGGMLALGRWFADAMLVRRADVADADAIVAMPLAPSRQRERGFNQALEIARVLAKTTGIPLAAHALERERETPPQAGLPWRDRARNVTGAFVCREALYGRSVIVVDDVMTTGTSLHEVALTLKRAGAERVENWLVARTLPPLDA